MKYLNVVLVCAAVLVISPRSAEASSGSVVANQITKIGNQQGVNYFGAQGIPASCLYGIFYVDANLSPDDAAISRAMSLLVAAYLSGKPVTRVDYVQNSDNTCHPTLIEF